MFARNLKELLKKHNKKQSELAQFVGVKRNTVNDWINKGSSPKIEHLCAIKIFFNVSLDYLLANEETTQNLSKDFSDSVILQGNNATTLTITNGQNIPKDTREKRIEAEIVKMFNELNLKQQTQVLSYIFQLQEETTTQNKM